LLIHGVLHLCGYDHERSRPEAWRMQWKERQMRRRLGPITRLVRTRHDSPVRTSREV
jgi:probable rRNA maturation factor